MEMVPRKNQCTLTCIIYIDWKARKVVAAAGLVLLDIKFVPSFCIKLSCGRIRLGHDSNSRMKSSLCPCLNISLTNNSIKITSYLFYF